MENKNERIQIKGIWYDIDSIPPFINMPFDKVSVKEWEEFYRNRSLKRDRANLLLIQGK